MIVSSAMKSLTAQPSKTLEAVPDPGGSTYAGRVVTRSKQSVSPESAKQVHTVYRCANGISDDIASMPLKHYRRIDGRTTTVEPDAVIRNLAYLLEVSPNRWMTPFVLKKTVINWLLFWGNALVWRPAPPAARELFVLPISSTLPKLDEDGNLWYETRFPNGEKRMIPSVEVMSLMINSTNGVWGKSVLEYARETIGQRVGMSETKSSILANGLNPSAYIQVSSLLNKDERQVYKDAYSEAMHDQGGLVVFDQKITKFEPISMKLTDAEFLENMNATDLEIANFFKYPAYKLNMGKESYQSNEQQDLDYLKSCIDPLAVQWEQGARLRWLSEGEQKTDYIKFNRSAILRTNAKSRAELYEIEIRNGLLQPNEARGLEDRDSYPLGDAFYITSNYAEVGASQNATA